LENEGAVRVKRAYGLRKYVYFQNSPKRVQNQQRQKEKNYKTNTSATSTSITNSTHFLITLPNFPSVTSIACYKQI
jgi:hypothetical protein